MLRRTSSTAEPRCGVNRVREWRRSRSGDTGRVTGQRPVLHREHVGCVAAQAPGLQCVGYGLLVHDGAPPHVDQEGPWAQVLQQRRVDEMAGLAGERQRHHYDVACLGELSEAVIGHRQRPLGLGVKAPGVVVGDL